MYKKGNGLQTVKEVRNETLVISCKISKLSGQFGIIMIDPLTFEPIIPPAPLGDIEREYNRIDMGTRQAIVIALVVASFVFIQVIIFYA